MFNFFTTLYFTHLEIFKVRPCYKFGKKKKKTLLGIRPNPFVWLVADGWCWFVLREKVLLVGC
jgi:hypothetical protein